MYKVANAQRVILFSGLYFLLLGNLFASSGSQDKNLPVAISYETMTESERVEAGLVAAVDSGKLTGEQSWSYTLKQGGDYQLGTAWVEVLSAGEVEIVMTLNGKAVKTVTAINDPSKPKGPTSEDYGLFRLESRFEELAPGSRIEIKAVPSGDVAYRLAFHLVSTTPTFEGLKVFNAADFGALGDGVQDDMAAIHKVVDAAKAAGGGIIRFEKEKIYRVIGKKDMEYEAVFDLENAVNIKIEGQGSTLVLHPPDGLANIYHARNIQIDGFSIDYAPLPYFQGAITDINLEAMTMDLKVPDRYPVPETGKTYPKQPIFGRSFIPDFPGARSGSGNNISIDTVSALGDERSIRLQFRKTATGTHTPNAAMRGRVKRAKEEGATEFVVPHLRYGHQKGFTHVKESARVKLSNLRYYLVPYFWMSVIGNTGPVTFQNVDLKMKTPETELLASWRDGFHIKNGRYGTLIDSCDMDGAAQYDDTFAIYTRVHKVIDFTENKLHLKPGFSNHKDIATWFKGDWVSIWNADQTEFRGMRRLVQVTDVAGKNRFYLSLESLPAGTQAGDTVINEEVLNRGTLIRNCSTSQVGTENSSTRFRASDIRFENNRFEDFDFNMEFSSFWGTPRARGVLVKNCYIGGGQSYIGLSSPIDMLFEDCRFDHLILNGRRNAENIRLKNVSWMNAGEQIIQAGIGSDFHFEGMWEVNGVKVNSVNPDIKKRINVEMNAEVVFPDGSKLGKKLLPEKKVAGTEIIKIKSSGYKETGKWTMSNLPGYRGRQSNYSSDGGSASFTPTLEKAGEYTVYVYKVSHRRNNRKQAIIIHHNGKRITEYFDMRAGPSAWVKLGSYYFEGNGKESVVIKSEEGNAPARTSAVKFVFGGKQ